MAMLRPAVRCGSRVMSCERPLIMGILNVTPDSFSDGGRYGDTASALTRAQEMVAEGADLIDVGGESTRPGASPVPIQEECRRIIPVIERLASDLDRPISVDTRHAEVMQKAVAAGATLVNDIEALTDPASLDCLLNHDVAVCLMHMQGEPESMQREPYYAGDVVQEVRHFLVGRARWLERQGVGRDRILIDPGFGFGKTRDHNLALLAHLDALVDSGYALLAGLSRKSMLVDQPGTVAPMHRTGGSLAAMLWAVQAGASMVRVHDVAESRQALDIWTRLKEKAR